MSFTIPSAVYSAIPHVAMATAFATGATIAQEFIWKTDSFVKHVSISALKGAVLGTVALVARSFFGDKVGLAVAGVAVVTFLATHPQKEMFSKLTSLFHTSKPETETTGQDSQQGNGSDQEAQSV